MVRARPGRFRAGRPGADRVAGAEERTFTLPGGLIVPGSRCLRAAVLRPLTGRTEEWLAAHGDAPSAVAVTCLLGSCLVGLEGASVGPDLARRLLVGDRDYLMLQLRRLTLGDTFRAVVTCPACGERMDVDIPVDEIAVEPRPQTAMTETLMVEGSAVTFRLPTGGDQEAVLGHEPEVAAEALLARCLADTDNAVLSPAAHDAVIEAMDRRAPQVDLELDLACPECGQDFLLPFDTTTFFLSEMRAQGRQLLHEIHSLALYYHWSEADILSLTRARRRDYLALLADTLRRD